MKFISILMTMILPITALAGNGSGNVSNVVGIGATGTTVNAPTAFFSIPAGAQIFSLYAGDIQANQTATNYYPFYKNGVAYQVTAGKTAYCFNFTLASGSTAAGVSVQLISATASFAFNANSITGGVYQFGASAKAGFVVSPTAQTQAAWPGVYTFGASTYPGFQAGNSQNFVLHADCYEQ